MDFPKFASAANYVQNCRMLYDVLYAQRAQIAALHDKDAAAVFNDLMRNLYAILQHYHQKGDITAFLAKNPDCRFTALNVQLDILTQLMQKPVKITINDPTHTPLGGMLAQHLSKHIAQAISECGKIHPYDYLLGRGCYANSLYESIHQAGDTHQLYSQNYTEIIQRFPAMQENTQDRFAAYLESATPKAVENTFFVFSKSMSDQQKGMFLWFRGNYNFAPRPTNEQRVYLNIKPVYLVEGVNYVATALTQFLAKNNLTPYIYCRFKIRESLADTDRADMCIVYFDIDVRLVQQQPKIIGYLHEVLAKIPTNYINPMTSPFLTAIAPGLAFADDNVRTDEGASYTSQVSKSFSIAFQSLGNVKPMTEQEWQDVCGRAILICVEDLRKRGYPV